MGSGAAQHGRRPPTVGSVGVVLAAWCFFSTLCSSLPFSLFFPPFPLALLAMAVPAAAREGAPVFRPSPSLLFFMARLFVLFLSAVFEVSPAGGSDVKALLR